jgi:hypothetical protein
MKTITLLSVVSFICLQSFAQVTYRKVPETTQPIAPYDSLMNIPITGSRSLIGQKVLVLSSFRFHKTMDSNSPEENIIRKEFEIKDIQRSKNNLFVWLTLVTPVDTIFHELHGAESKSFVTVGYFEKQTKIYTGKKFKLIFPEEFKELNTEIIKKFDTKERFVCTGSTIIQEGKKLIPALTLKSSNGDEIYTPIKGFEVTTANSIQLFIIE